MFGHGAHAALFGQLLRTALLLFHLARTAAARTTNGIPAQIHGNLGMIQAHGVFDACAMEVMRAAFELHDDLFLSGGGGRLLGAALDPAHANGARVAGHVCVLLLLLLLSRLLLLLSRFLLMMLIMSGLRFGDPMIPFLDPSIVLRVVRGEFIATQRTRVRARQPRSDAWLMEEMVAGHEQEWKCG